MQYLLTEEENKERVDAVESCGELLQLRRSLALARGLILGDYQCHSKPGDGASDGYCDDCPLGSLLVNSGVEYKDWKTICGRATRFSK